MISNRLVALSVMGMAMLQHLKPWLWVVQMEQDEPKAFLSELAPGPPADARKTHDADIARTQNHACTNGKSTATWAVPQPAGELQLLAGCACQECNVGVRNKMESTHQRTCAGLCLVPWSSGDGGGRAGLRSTWHVMAAANEHKQTCKISCEHVCR